MPQNYNGFEEIIDCSVFWFEEMVMSAECKEVEYKEFDLVIRSEITIEASTAVVWAELARLERWKDSIHSLEHIAGTPGQTGGRVRIGQRRGERIVYVTQEILAVQSERYRVEYLQTEDGSAARGYIVYSLYAQASGTLVVCDLLLRAVVSADQLAGNSLETISNMARTGTREKLDCDHLVLKRLCENG